MEAKKVIRKQIFARRKEWTDEQVRAASHVITEKVTEQPEYKEASRILAYVDYNHEAMTGELIEKAWADGKEVAVPKVVGKDMVFYKLINFDQLEDGYYGIREPARGEIVDWTDALMIMPGVAFDANINRCGYGGGFYDRFLEKHPHVKRLAIAFQFQVVDAVPTEETDIRPQVLVTEENIYRD